MSLKAGIYDPYLDTLGGGERYTLTVAEILSQHGYDVDLFWSGDQEIISKAASRFALDLSKVSLVTDIFHVCPECLEVTDDTSQLKKLSQIHHQSSGVKKKTREFLTKIHTTRRYDLFFYLTDGSLPFIFSRKNILHFQVPFNHYYTPTQTALNHLKLKQFNQVVCNSKFTKKIIDQNFGTNSSVLYPPVDVSKFFNSSSKENIILTVGRFDNILNAKKQDVLIDAFKQLSPQIRQNWQFILMGGSLENPDTNHYLQLLQKQATGLPIKFIVNPSFTELQQVYGSAKIYWHAAGYQVDETIHPEFTEHFGMTVVESMASGLVPVIIKKGGLPEIIKHQHNGFLWESVDELTKTTTDLISSPSKLSNISTQAIATSLNFSKEKFTENLMELLK